jgi:branched-chain amino acid transport system ATP-binding protein
MSDIPVLAVQDLNAFYGRARALEDVSFEMGKESVAIIGRNGMG